MAEATVATEPRPRLESVDVVRGVIMILMALDHTRDFFGQTSFSPTDPTQTTIPLFFTRWVTHFCAPVFFLLTGTGAYLSLRKKSKDELSKFLFTRGLWLIFLEITLFRCLGLQFNFDYHLTLLDVLWALGWAMIVLSALVHLPTPVVAAFGVVMIADAQFARPNPVLQPSVVHLALSQFHYGKSAALRLCRVSADSLGRSHRCWIRPGANLCLDIRSSKNIPVAGRAGSYGRLRDSPRH